MRADRLLSFLLLLQTRGKMSAFGLAQELEVSERTIYRDLEALSIAGIPVYAERGPGGGISLLDDYTTRLNGLTADEARALFILSIPGPLLQLGIGPDLKAAMLKLSAALPESQRREQDAARQRLHLDASSWGQSGAATPNLGVVQQGVWQDQRLDILIHTHFGAEVPLVVDPLGLVAKANDWQLVARRESGLRVFRVADLVRVRLLDETFLRPDNFSLSVFWDTYCQQVEAERGLFWVDLRISAGLARELPLRMGDRARTVLEGVGPTDESGWRTVRMAFDSFERARDQILSFGGAAQVLDPPQLARSLADTAEQIRKMYECST